jgi:signal transduction histidine kinase
MKTRRTAADPDPARKPSSAKSFGLRRREPSRRGKVLRFVPESDSGWERVLSPVLEAAESRQRRVGGELHEGLSQHLAGLALLAGALAARLGRGCPEEVGAALEIAQGLGATVQTARELALGLYPVDAVFGGAYAILDHVAARACRERQVHWEMHHEGQEPELEESRRIQLCRILEETIDQAVRERGAGRVRVELRCEDRGFLLLVADDGRNTGRAACASRVLLACQARLFGAQMRVRKCLGGGRQVSFRWEQGTADQKPKAGSGEARASHQSSSGWPAKIQRRAAAAR